MCLQYKPTVVACFCIHLACKWSNWEIPQSNEGKDWFWYVDKSVSLDQLEQLTSEFLVIFDKCPTKLKHKIKSISATQNTTMPQSISASPFDMEPRKIRPPDGSSTSQSVDGQGPSFRPHHSHPESKPGQLTAPEDPFKKQQPNNQPAQRVDYREYREKKERERQEREKMSHASGSRDHHHHHHNHGQQPPHKTTVSNKTIPPAPQAQHHKPPNSAVTASRDAARREQAHARDMNRKRSEFTFGPLVRHEPTIEGQPLTPLDTPVVNHVVNSVSKKDGQEWDIETSEGLVRHGTPSEKFRDKETIARHSQSIDPSKRGGPNFDGSVKHSSKVNSDNRSSANSSTVLSDNRVIKEPVPRGTDNASNLPKAESDVSHQKHLYNHNRHKTSEGQELPKRPPPPGHDVSSKRVATPPPASIRPNKSSEHRVDHSALVKREEEVAASNGKVPAPHHHSHHSKSKDSKSPSLQQLHHRSRSPAVSTLASVPVPKSKSPLPAIPAVAEVRSKSPSVAPTSNKISSQSQYFTPGQGVKSSETVSARNGTLHHVASDEKQPPPVVEKPVTPPRMVEAEVPVTSPPVSTRMTQKITTPEKGGHTLRERESPYPHRQKRQRTPPSSGKKQPLPPPPPPPPPPPVVPVQEMPTPVSPSSGIMSPFGSPPPTPTTPGKVLPSTGTPVSSRITTRNRTSSSSSEPELVPLVTKLDQMAGYENIIRDSRMSIKLPGPVPDIIQPIRDRKTEEVAAVSGAKVQALSVAKELKPPELIPPFSLAQPVDMGAVAFPSPVAEGVNEPDASSDFNATECANVIDVISVTEPLLSPEKTVLDVPKSFPSLLPTAVEVKKSSSEYHHKSEKKKKKDKHKHKDKDKNREDRKKSKHKNKDKDRHKDRPETSSLAGTSAPIKITIPKDKLVSLPPAPEPPSASSNSGLKLKIQKDRLKGSDSTGSSPQAVKLEPPLKIKIVKEKVESVSTNTPVTNSSSGKESRKRERSSPKSGVDHQSSSQPPLKSARLSESQNRRSASNYNKQNGVESRSSSGSGRGHSQPFTAGTKMVTKLADSHNSQSKGKAPTAGNQQ
ncbi:cyclin-T isoform X2 [Anabrus simplex]